MAKLTVFVVLLLVLMSLSLTVTNARDLHKRLFQNIGCGGAYDKAKFARLDRICLDCKEMYREPELHEMCR